VLLVVQAAGAGKQQVWSSGLQTELAQDAAALLVVQATGAGEQEAGFEDVRFEDAAPDTAGLPPRASLLPQHQTQSYDSSHFMLMCCWLYVTACRMC
jgi:hypothetical protein